jgi:HD-like signal output (HDOD) protein
MTFDMLVAGISIATVALALCGWIALRRRGTPVVAPPGAPANHPIGVAPNTPSTPQLRSINTVRVEGVSALAAARLWRLAFSVPAQLGPVTPAHVRVRDTVTALLREDTIDPKYLPRRPTLMPQLVRAVNDPDAAPDAVSRILAQDPVLTGDVLRLANSNFYRVTPEPVETIQRAVVICGMDGLQSLLTTALLQPVFQATDKNFPRLPLLLWERTQRAARAAELYAAKAQRQDRFEAQLVALLSALGPLAVYRATMAAYARVPGLAPHAGLCVELISALGQQVSQRIARHWQSSPRLAEALGPISRNTAADHSLAHALFCGELIGTLSLLEAQRDISPRERLQLTEDAGLPEEMVMSIWEKLAGAAK